jgi:4-hydroxy-4-methyl-2-oxoglutarate aldolase
MNYLIRLLQLDSCALSDAMDALRLPAGISGIRRLSGQGTIAGRVVTVELVAGIAPPDRPKVHLCAAAIQRANAGDVIVVAHPRVDSGGWGGVLSTAASYRGVAGVVVDGPSRDIDEANDMGFPVFARGTTPRTARGRVYEIATGTPIQVADVTVNEADYVIADGSGVVFVPAERIDEVLTKAESIATRERYMSDALMQGESVTKVLDKDYEDMLKPN